MKGNNNVIVYNKEKNKAKKLISNSDLIFCLDLVDVLISLSNINTISFIKGKYF